jgi:hypothetical protein
MSGCRRGDCSLLGTRWFACSRPAALPSLADVFLVSYVQRRAISPKLLETIDASLIRSLVTLMPPPIELLVPVPIPLLHDTVPMTRLCLACLHPHQSATFTTRQNSVICKDNSTSPRVDSISCHNILQKRRPPWLRLTEN